MVVLTRGAYAEPGTSLNFKTGNWRSTEMPAHIHAKAPCHAACPAGEDQQAWFAKLQEGHAEAAWAELVLANPLPAVTGRVCPHPCESACNRAALDGALAIHSVERWLGDEAIRFGWKYPVVEPAADLLPGADLGLKHGENCDVGPGASPGNSAAARTAYYQLNRVAENGHDQRPDPRCEH